MATVQDDGSLICSPYPGQSVNLSADEVSLFHLHGTARKIIHIEKASLWLTASVSAFILLSLVTLCFLPDVDSVRRTPEEAVGGEADIVITTALPRSTTVCSRSPGAPGTMPAPNGAVVAVFGVIMIAVLTWICYGCLARLQREAGHKGGLRTLRRSLGNI